MNNLLIKVAI